MNKMRQSMRSGWHKKSNIVLLEMGLNFNLAAYMKGKILCSNKWEVLMIINLERFLFPVGSHEKVLWSRSSCLEVPSCDTAKL